VEIATQQGVTNALPPKPSSQKSSTPFISHGRFSAPYYESSLHLFLLSSVLWCILSLVMGHEREIVEKGFEQDRLDYWAMRDKLLAKYPGK
jgi:hypothetical protein